MQYRLAFRTGQRTASERPVLCITDATFQHLLRNVWSSSACALLYVQVQHTNQVFMSCCYSPTGFACCSFHNHLRKQLIISFFPRRCVSMQFLGIICSRIKVPFRVRLTTLCLCVFSGQGGHSSERNGLRQEACARSPCR